MKTQVRYIITATGIMAYAILFMVMSACTSAKSGEAPAGTPDVDIHTAVLTGNHDALRQHIAAGSNLNERDPFGGSSPLITAALFGKTEEARMLLDAGAEINFQNNDGSTALHVASFFCRPEIVSMLLERGADKTIQNRFNATPYQGVAGPFEEVKNSYDMLGKALEPMGLKLDYAYLQKTRPEMAELLK